jgi:hypothetical protein
MATSTLSFKESVTNLNSLDFKVPRIYETFSFLCVYVFLEKIFLSVNIATILAKFPT